MTKVMASLQDAPAADS